MNTRGFTLVEMIVASTIVVGIMGTTVLCMTSGTRSEKVVTMRSGVLQTARVALDRIAADLRLAVPLHPDGAFVGIDRVIEEVEMEADNVDFATRNYRPVRPGEGDVCETSYFVSRDPQTGEWCLYRRRDPSPDHRPFEGGVRERIARGVRGFRLEYTDGVLWENSWGRDPRERDMPTNALDVGPIAPLPDAVRISIALAPPLDPRRPPDPDADVLVFQRVVRLQFAERYRNAGLGGEVGDIANTPSGDGASPGAPDGASNG